VNEEEHGGNGEEMRRAARPYAVVVGVLFLAVIVYAGINSASNKPLGLQPGARAPKFAAPSATGTLSGDANVNPTRACQVRGRDVINICRYADRPVVLTVWFSRCGGHCEPQLDRIERVRSQFPRVAFLGLDVRDSLEKARSAVHRHGWRFPMAVDRDGAVSSLYGVVVGPTTFFIYPGARPLETGVIRKVVRHEIDERTLTTEVEALVAASRKRERARGHQ
jgi:peroxiredoxin